MGDGFFAPTLLWGHVRGGADGVMRRRQLGALETFGNAEIGQFDFAFRCEHDVGRLQVAMDDAAFVGML